MDGAAARRRGRLRAPHRHLHSRGDIGCRRPPPRAPGRPRYRLRRAAAGQRLQRRPQLGLRRRALVRRARAVRRPGRVSALRRRLSCGGARRDPGRRLQPPRPERKLPARVRAVPPRRRIEHLGLLGGPRRVRGATLHRRERADVAARLPRRRAAARRRPCAEGQRAGAHPAGAGGIRRCAQRAPRPAAHPHRGVGSQRRPAHLGARGRRLRAHRAVERRLSPRSACRAHGGDHRVLRGLRLARLAGEGFHPRLLPRRDVVVVPGSGARAPHRSRASPPGGS